jgi:Holliday junction resolvasome RuvABC endonuclease subunit
MTISEGRPVHTGGPRVVGLDLSLTRTGIACYDGSAHVLRPKTRGCERMVEIREGILDWMIVPTWPVDLVAIEGFSYGSKGRAVFDIGGIGWVIRVALHETGIRYVEVPPSVLKRYATGRGNADKQAMQMAAAKRLGYDDDKPDDNIVDALWLRALAMDAYGHPVCSVPQAQRDAAVNALTWPRLTAAARH